MPPSDVIRADFDRIASCSADLPDALEPTAQRLVTATPLRSRVLEIGCGTGALARELAAKRGANVTAIDLSPRMIEVARTRTHGTLGIEYRVADVMKLSPRGFDVVVAVNTLHHLPLGEIAQRMANSVVSGGRVLIADLFDARGLGELPYNAVAWALGSTRTRPDAELEAAWDAHSQHDRILDLASIKNTLREVLPGVVIRRRLRWRYTAIWRKP
jgi:2-polyprenyl-3-methyl-5-hydroxy-6-metoxy-1,4-benzoquinol methylase